MSQTDAPAVGIVGLGGMGKKHARHLRDDGCTVAGGADVAESARNEFASEFGAHTDADHAAMYDAVDPDAVVVTTPNTFHAPAATAALERGIDVLCEKPLADTLENAERIAAAAADSEAFCMVGFHNRFNTAPEVCRAYREAGRFGEVTHVEANYVRRRGIPGVGSWFTDRSLSGGGALVDIGVHAVDFALHLAGFPAVEEVWGTVRRDFADGEYENPDHFFGDFTIEDDDVFDVDDSATAYLRCADDTTVALDVAWAVNRPATDEFVLRGTGGGARCGLGGETLDVFECGLEGTDHYADTEIRGEYDPAGHAAQDRYFADRVRAGEAPERNTLEQGLAVQRVIDAIYESSERGEAVRP